MTRLLRTVLLAFAAATSASAQGTPNRATPQPARGEISGRVISGATQAPIAAVRVAILAETSPDTRPDTVARAVTGLDGTFRVRALPLGTYRVHVTAVGFAPRDLEPVTLTAAAPTHALAVTALTAVAVELNSVVVRDTRAALAADLSPDRNTFSVKKMPATKGGSALDVLRNVPSVDVDIENIVSLRGNSGVIIQINGRPSPMKAAQLGNFLAQLPADVVDKIEVISNPSAREDPTGVAGIINVVLKEEADAGTNGGLTLGGSTTGNANIGANYGVDRGPWSLYGSYGLIDDHRRRVDGIGRNNLFDHPTTYLDEYGLRLQHPFMHTFTANVTYAFSKKDEASWETVFSTRGEGETYDVRYTNLSPSRTVSSMTSRFTDGMNHESSLESTLSYKHAFAAKGHRFATELRFDQGTEGGPTNVTSRSLSNSGTPTAVTGRESAMGWDRPTEVDLKLDYVHPFAKGLRFESGYKGSYQRFHTTLDTKVQNLATGVFAPDTSRINNFTMDQVVNAAYGMVSKQLGDFVLQGGVRAEHASTSFQILRGGTKYDNSYDELFPSGLVIYSMGGERQLKLSYSTRIKRPDEGNQLDPTLHYLDPLNISRGNPKLKPEIIRALELAFQQQVGDVTVQATPYFRRTFDAVRSISTIDSAGVATRTYGNIATSDASGLDVTVAFGGKRFSGFAGASGYRQQSNANNLATGLSVNTFGWTARSNLTWRVTKTIDVQGLYSYQAPVDVVQGRNDLKQRLSLAARERFFDDQLSVTLRVLDPFSMSRERSITNDPRFYQVSDRAREIRGIGISLTWTFGKPDKEKNDLLGEPPSNYDTALLFECPTENNIALRVAAQREQLLTDLAEAHLLIERDRARVVLPNA